MYTMCHHERKTENTTATLPEAQCSVNVRFRVEGYPDYAQATGRGTTPEEAARNLRETIDATKQALETPAPKTREERLAELLACGLRKATAHQDWSLVERLTKAVVLVLSDAVQPPDAEHPSGMYRVNSQTRPDVLYLVDGTTCNCPDARRHTTDETAYWCKHAAAVVLYRKLSDTV